MHDKLCINNYLKIIFINSENNNYKKIYYKHVNNIN